MKLEDIKKIMEALEKSELKKMVIKQDDFELHLEKQSTQSVTLAEPQLAVTKQVEKQLKEQAEESTAKDKSGYVESPMVGTFYSCPAPDQPTFVKVGDSVVPDTVVCIIEAMKVMNEVKAGVNGKVVEMLVENGQPVEFGTPLFRVE